MYNYEHERDKNNVFLANYEKALGVKKHFHNCMEFVYVIDGEAIAHIDDAEYRLTSGAMCAVSCFSPHYYETLKDGTYLVVLIPHRYFRDYDSAFNAKTFTHPIIADNEAKCLLNILQMAVNLCAGQNVLGETSDKLTDEFKASQLHFISSLLINICIGQCGLSERHRISSLVADAVNIIENDFKKDISVASICQKLGCYQKKLSSNFEKTMNMSVLNYIERTRVLEAARLLSNCPNMTVETVMLESGFNSSRSFLRHFRSVFGCTPTEYKSKNKI